jgi:hypothetical protein
MLIAFSSFPIERVAFAPLCSRVVPPVIRRAVLLVLPIKERGQGAAMKADLGLCAVQELDITCVVAIGECTGSDPLYSEAKQLIARLADVSDLGFIFASTKDPA